jgi:hypothetical protein
MEFEIIEFKFKLELFGFQISVSKIWIPNFPETNFTLHDCMTIYYAYILKISPI